MKILNLYTIRFLQVSSRSWTAILAGLVLLGGIATNLPAQDATTILKEVDQALFPLNYQATLEMDTKRPNQATKTMGLRVMAKSGQGSLIEITAPVRSKGIRFLEKDGSLSMYNPRAGSRKAIRLSAQDAFQGSLFGNSDISEPNYSRDYTAVIRGRENLVHPVLGSIDCLVLQGKAAHDKAPYGKIEIWLWGDDHIPVKIQFYAKSGLLFRTMVLSDMKILAGKRRPAAMSMEAATEPGATTFIRIAALEARDDISDAVFTDAYLIK